jgi:hypothetical protein
VATSATGLIKDGLKKMAAHFLLPDRGPLLRVQPFPIPFRAIKDWAATHASHEHGSPGLFWQVLRNTGELACGDVPDAALEVQAAVADIVTDPEVPQAVQEQHVGVPADESE